MKKLVVCGDSWMSAYEDRRLIHFSDIISDELDYECYNLAQPGCGNRSIILQLETALKIKPDLLIFNTTAPNRIEIPFEPFQYSSDENNYDVLNLFHYRYKHLQDKLNCYTDRPKLLYGTPDLIQHKYFYDLSIKIDNCSNESDFKEQFCNLKEAGKMYMTYLSNWWWEEKQSSWMLYYILHKIKESDLKYLIVLDHMKMHQYCDWIDDTNSILPWLENLHYYRKRLEDYISNVDKDFAEPHFHTIIEDQYDIANKILLHLKKFIL